LLVVSIGEHWPQNPRNHRSLADFFSKTSKNLLTLFVQRDSATSALSAAKTRDP
jgi:hypothetical protein